MTQGPVEAVAAIIGASPGATAGTTPSTVVGSGSFAKLLVDGVNTANQQLVSAETLATSFATNDSVPVHQVTYALEQARLSMELMIQIRSRLVEGFQELLRMQL